MLVVVMMEAVMVMMAAVVVMMAAVVVLYQIIHRQLKKRKIAVSITVGLFQCFRSPDKRF